MIVTAFVLVAIPFAFLLLEVVLKGPLTVHDQQVADELNRYNVREDDGVELARVVTQLGSTAVLVAVVVVAVVWLAVFHRRRRQALFLVVTAALGLALNNVLKVVVGRARPHFAHGGGSAFGSSFPSGHAMNSTVVYGCLLVIAWPFLRSVRARIGAFVVTAGVVLAIAASRVVLTVHYVSDVVAGIVLGTAFVLASAAAFTAWRQEGGRLPEAIASAPAVGEDAPAR
ncbi:MAG: phosphatase PAP2 family protein [Ilumatobacteraceae bacterium]